jgi:hypothetical protein
MMLFIGPHTTPVPQKRQRRHQQKPIPYRYNHKETWQRSQLLGGESWIRADL